MKKLLTLLVIATTLIFTSCDKKEDGRYYIHVITHKPSFPKLYLNGQRQKLKAERIAHKGDIIDVTDTGYDEYYIHTYDNGVSVRTDSLIQGSIDITLIIESNEGIYKRNLKSIEDINFRYTIE
jgi:hypothetical protein